MSQIIINGKVISGNFSGRNISVHNGTVIVDGQSFEIEEKVINIEIHGNVEKIDVAACNQLIVNGDVDSVKTTSGDVKCNNITGSVGTVSGDVRATTIGGSVKTVSGDITH